MSVVDRDICERFELVDGQFFSDYIYKNLKWELDGVRFGFGDLTESNILYIMSQLNLGEEFVGWNEHHGSRYQQTSTPMIRIRNNSVKRREDIIKEEGR